MKFLLISFAAVLVLTIAVVLWWALVTRPRLHRTPHPGADANKVQRCPRCGHLPYYDRPEDCDVCGGMGFINIEPKEKPRG